MTDAVAHDLIQGIPVIITALGTLVTAVAGIVILKKQSTIANDAAEKVDTVAKEASGKADELQRTVAQPIIGIHQMVNSNYQQEKRRAEIAEAKLAESEARAVALAKKLEGGK
jgi:hypothetical protein